MSTALLPAPNINKLKPHFNKMLLVGCGNMGGALLSSWYETKIIKDNVIIIAPNKAAQSDAKHIVSNCSQILDTENIDLVIFAVKPQIIESILPSYQIFFKRNSNCLFVSLVAGKTISMFKHHLGEDAKVIRVMPNMPAIIYQATTVIHCSKQITNEQKALIYHLFSIIGKVFEVDDESQLDTVTAISGSGPAYVFLLAEILTELATEFGLSSALATEITNNTIKGSAVLLGDSLKSAKSLRKQVTSPQGTTESALQYLMGKPGLKELLYKAVRAAIDKSKEIATQ